MPSYTTRHRTQIRRSKGCQRASAVPRYFREIHVFSPSLANPVRGRLKGVQFLRYTLSLLRDTLTRCRQKTRAPPGLSHFHADVHTGRGNSRRSCPALVDRTSTKVGSTVFYCNPADE